MSSGHYCDGCARAYYNCECKKVTMPLAMPGETNINFESRAAFENAIRQQPGDDIPLEGGIMNFGRQAFIYLNRDTQSRWEAWQTCWLTHVLPRLSKESMS